MRLGEVTTQFTEQLRTRGFEQPLAEAHLLICGVLGWTRTQVISDDQKQLATAQLEQLRSAIERRLQGEPLAYILGRKDFYKSIFHVGPGALIPRPETEMLVEFALKHFPNQQHELWLADFGAGSGCVGISILLERPQARLVAVESSMKAQEYLRKNLQHYGLEERCEILHLEVEKFKCTKKFDLVVANPPYIAADDKNVASDVQSFEPPTALYADQNGLGAIRRWAEVAGQVLRPQGLLLMEIGASQKAAVLAEPWSKWGFSAPEIKKDLAGLSRMIVAMLR
ncbi:MAG: peptide chain release factor N(5)-glutamine methyltransferase [Bdellovibrionales bacterium]